MTYWQDETLPTEAELRREEADTRSIHYGRAMCPHGCRVSAVTHDSPAMLAHLENVHGEVWAPWECPSCEKTATANLTKLGPLGVVRCTCGTESKASRD